LGLEVIGRLDYVLKQERVAWELPNDFGARKAAAEQADLAKPEL